MTAEGLAFFPPAGEVVNSLEVRGWRDGMGDMANEIAGNHAGLTELLCGQISGKAPQTSAPSGTA